LQEILRLLPHHSLASIALVCSALSGCRDIPICKSNNTSWVGQASREPDCNQHQHCHFSIAASPRVMKSIGCSWTGSSSKLPGAICRAATARQDVKDPCKGSWQHTNLRDPAFTACRLVHGKLVNSPNLGSTYGRSSQYPWSVYFCRRWRCAREWIESSQVWHSRMPPADRLHVKHLQHVAHTVLPIALWPNVLHIPLPVLALCCSGILRHSCCIGLSQRGLLGFATLCKSAELPVLVAADYPAARGFATTSSAPLHFPGLLLQPQHLWPLIAPGSAEQRLPTADGCLCDLVAVGHVCQCPVLLLACAGIHHLTSNLLACAGLLLALALVLLLLLLPATPCTDRLGPLETPQSDLCFLVVPVCRCWFGSKECCCSYSRPASSISSHQLSNTSGASITANCDLTLQNLCMVACRNSHASGTLLCAVYSPCLTCRHKVSGCKYGRLCCICCKYTKRYRLC